MLQNHLALLKLLLGKKINHTGHQMVIRIFFFAMLYCVNIPSVIAKNEKNVPEDVISFFHDADICQYLAGEWDSNLPQKRKKELSNEMNKTCSNIYKRQEHFKKNISEINSLCRN